LAEALEESYLELVIRLVDRLERLSADSTYAHRASGLRGSLLLTIQRMEAGASVDKTELDQLVDDGFQILKDAAEEIGGSR